MGEQTTTKAQALKRLMYRHRASDKSPALVRQEVLLLAQQNNWPDVIVAVNIASTQDRIRAATSG